MVGLAHSGQTVQRARHLTSQTVWLRWRVSVATSRRKIAVPTLCSGYAPSVPRIVWHNCTWAGAGSGQPASCNSGCAAVLLPYYLDCRQALQAEPGEGEVRQLVALSSSPSFSLSLTHCALYPASRCWRPCKRRCSGATRPQLTGVAAPQATVATLARASCSCPSSHRVFRCPMASRTATQSLAVLLVPAPCYLRAVFASRICIIKLNIHVLKCYI